MEQPRWLADGVGRAWPARGFRQRRQRAHPRLLPRRRPAGEPARRGRLVRGVRRRLPRTRRACLDALADGALVFALGRGAGRGPLRRRRRVEPRQRSRGRARRVSARRDRRPRRAARRQPGRCGERRRVPEDAAARAFAGRRRSQLRRPTPAPPAPESDALFDRALAHVLEMEGGFTDDPYDPGGPTNRGITLKVFAAWKGVPLDEARCAALQGGAAPHPRGGGARHLFRALLDAGALRRARPALAFFHFDAAVNHGVTGAMRLLAARRRHRRRRRDRPQHARRHRTRFPSTRRCSATPRRAARAIARCTTSGASGAGGWRASTRRWRARVEIARSDADTTPTSTDEQKGPTPMADTTSEHAADRKVVGTVDHHLGRHHHRPVDGAAGARPGLRHRHHRRSRARSGRGNRADGASGWRSPRHDHDDLRTRARHASRSSSATCN